jgi:hypothetical protein
MYDHVVGPFFFVERTIIVDIYLNMLEQFVFPQITNIEREDVTGVFQQVGAMSHFSVQVCLALNAVFPNQWM